MIVLTACTNRKRKPVVASLHSSSLRRAELDEVATDWASRLRAEQSRFLASDIYGGRGFREAAVASERLHARMMVVSAGLGLIFADQFVPPYACTVLAGAGDSIESRIVGAVECADWWRAISQKSPFATSLQRAIENHPGLICAALSETYVSMIAADLLALPKASLAKLRLFTRAPLNRVDPALRAFVMPYDDRLDGPDSPVRGTRGDFAGRALRHFADYIVTGIRNERSASEHADEVKRALHSWRLPERYSRIRYDDETLLKLIREHWVATGGSSTKLLRRFRDELNIACEQGRFAAIARQARAELA